MHHAPTGDVTLVFTDIQGSTALWEHLGDAFKPLLDHHNTLFRAAIAEFDGYEVKTEGDAFMVAFAEPKSAVRMCLAMQERLLDAPWPNCLNSDALNHVAGQTDDGLFRGIRVRMGIHSGVPECQLDPVTGRMDYFGRMVNRAARVSQLAHGGQILLSDDAWTALEADVASMSAEWVVEDLGEFLLKDIRDTQWVRQILPTRLSQRSFPQLRQYRRINTNLRDRADAFFGREQELLELAQRCQQGQRLITLMGAGGTGKTRLSLRFGSLQLPHFPGGVWFCDLADCRSQMAILSAVSTAWGLPLTDRDPNAQILELIKSRGRALIILDNFEQVTEHARATVGAWLQDSSESVFLVTSRILLRVRGECVLYLDPLPTQEAVNLFYERAQTVQPHFQRTLENEATVKEIVERLDCMSLAVELAAARVRMMDIDTIRMRLSQRFRLLQDRSFDHAERQSTLRNTIDWSWELLGEAERIALVQLSIFRGGCSLDAAEAILNLEHLDDAPWVTDVIGALVDHSLLRREDVLAGQYRYRMLESIREYAAEKYDATQSSNTRRYVHHYAQLGAKDALDALKRHGGIRQFERLVVELENITHAIELCHALELHEYLTPCVSAACEVLQVRGPFSEGLDLVMKASQIVERSPEKAQLCLLAGTFNRSMGQYEDALVNVRETMRLAQMTGEGHLEVRGLALHGQILMHRGALTEAEHCFEDALSLAKGLSDHTSQGPILDYFAGIYWQRAQLDEAAHAIKRAIEIARRIGDRRQEGVSLGHWAMICGDLGDVTEELAGHQEALAIAQDLGDLKLEGFQRGNIALIHQHEGRIGLAIEGFRESLRIARECGDRRNVAMRLGNLGRCYDCQGHSEKALTAYRDALELTRSVGERHLEGILLANIGELYLHQGHFETARDHLVQSIEICDETWRLNADMYRGLLAVSLAHLGRFHDAKQHLDVAEEFLRTQKTEKLAELLCRRAHVEHLTGQRNRAHTALSEAERLADECGATPQSQLGLIIQAVRRLMTN